MNPRSCSPLYPKPQLKMQVMRVMICITFLLLPIQAQSQNYNYEVDKTSQSMAFTSSPPGEAQSTVIAPGLKSQCPAGRFIVTNDIRRPPDGNSVLFRDLNATSDAFSNTTFDSIPLPSGKYAFKTNDHDVITMPNGNVILIWGIHFATDLNPKPGWFDITFKGTFGPGVRRGVMAWRSEDCGQSFHYMGAVDPATTADGSCAYPQYAKDAAGNITTAKPYANGGVDGQLVKLDPATKKIYLMFQCVGQKPDPARRTFTLTSEKLNKTMVLMSPDEGATWNMLGWLTSAAWRYGIVPMSNDRLAFARSNSFSFASKKSNGTYEFDQTAVPTPVADSGWPSFDSDAIVSIVDANVYGHTLIMRVPNTSNRLLIAYTTAVQVGAKNTNGYTVFFYDRNTKQFAQVNSIVPLNKDANSFTMHLTAIDPGTGPVLLYWYDVNWTTKKATIRGRLITGPDEYTGDFEIYKPASIRVMPAGPMQRINTFDLGSSGYWYGDYKTAHGYTVGTRRRPGGGPVLQNQQEISYNYFPMWVQPDKTVHYIRVSVTPGPVRAEFPHLQLVRIPQWRPGPPPVELQKIINPVEVERKALRNYREH